MLSKTFYVLVIFLAACSASKNVVIFSADPPPVKVSMADGLIATVNLQKSVNTVGRYFAGLTIDTAQIRYNWNGLDFSSARLQNMAGALAPTYLRVGGTAADYMTYDLNQRSENKLPIQGGGLYCGNFTVPFTMSVGQFDSLNNFVRIVGWDLIWDLNSLKRNADGSWNPDNARDLLIYAAKMNYSIPGFELGNEYDFFPHQVTPEQYAADYASLQKLLGEFSQYSKSFIVGPESGSGNAKYFGDFLIAGGSKYVRAGSFHHYYFKGSQGVVSKFLDVKIMDSLASHIESTLMQARIADPLLPVWISETSSAYNCGAGNMSDRFVAGFLWLDKLGLSAVKGIQGIIRQDFYGFNYGLLDLSMNPNPDFWLTVVYKRVVLGPVFLVNVSSPSIRVYASCANPNNFPRGSLAFSVLNPTDASVALNLPQFAGLPQNLFIFTAGDADGPLSKFTALNGKKLEMEGDSLPDLPPIAGAPGPVTLPPQSFGFVVLKNADIAICKEML